MAFEGACPDRNKKSFSHAMPRRPLLGVQPLLNGVAFTVATGRIVGYSSKARIRRRHRLPMEEWRVIRSELRAIATLVGEAVVADLRDISAM